MTARRALEAFACLLGRASGGPLITLACDDLASNGCRRNGRGAAPPVAPTPVSSRESVPALSDVLVEICRLGAPGGFGELAADREHNLRETR